MKTSLEARRPTRVVGPNGYSRQGAIYLLPAFFIYTTEDLHMKIAVFTFGRFNPPTTGHAMLVQKLEKTAQKVGGVPFLFASPSHDAKKNPLTYATKLRVLDKMAKKSTVVNRAEIRTPFDALSYLDSLQFDHVYMIVGSDRVREFKRNASKYIGTLYKNIKKFDVVSAGQRDPDATGVSGMSASKMRKAVVDGDLTSFRLGMPKTVGERDVRNVFKEIKKNMKLPEWIDMDELYNFIVEHGHEFSELDDLDSLFEANELAVYVVKTQEGDVEISRKVPSGSKVLGRSKEGTAKAAEKAPILNKGSIKSTIKPAIQKGIFRVTPTAKEFLDPEIIMAAEDSYGGSTSEVEKDVKDEKGKAAKKGEEGSGKPGKEEEPTPTVATPVSVAPIRRKSEQYAEYDPAVPHYQQKGRALRPRNASKVADMFDELPIYPDKQGRGVKYEWALCLASQLASGHSVEDIISRNEGGLLGVDRDVFALAVATLEHIPPEERGYVVHSDELDITGDPEPKTDICVMNPDGSIKRRISVKLDGDIQLASGEGRSSAKTIELAAQKAAELDPTFNAGLAQTIAEEVKSMPTKMMAPSNAEKYMAKYADKPEKIKEFFTDANDPNSIRPEKNWELIRENVRGKLLGNLGSLLKDSPVYTRVLAHEAMTGYYSFTEAGNPDAIADTMLSPMGMQEVDAGNPMGDPVTAKYADLAKVDIRAKSRGAVTSTTVRFDVAQKSLMTKGKFKAGAKKELAQTKTGQAALGMMDSVDYAFSTLITEEEGDNLLVTADQAQKDLETNALEYASEGLTEVMDIKMSMNIEGNPPKDLDRYNIISMGGKDIKIPVDEQFSALLEVQDRVDPEDTTTAKRKEKYNQKNRRAKEKSPKEDSAAPVSQEKPKAATDVDARFETEIDDPLTSRAGEWIGLEPDAKIARMQEIKDALYELLADPEMDGKLDPNDKYVKDWYVKARPFYDAHQEDENTVTLYGVASDIKDIIGNWESLDKQYEKISKKIKKSPVQSTTKHERDFDPPAEEPVEEPVEESVELDEAWTADSVMKNATIGSKKGYGINIKKTGGITKTPYKHMLMTNRPDKSIRVTFDHGKNEFEGTPKSVAAYLNKILGIKESVELDEARRDVYVVVDIKGKVVAAKLTRDNARKEVSRHRGGTIVLDPDAKAGDVLKKFAKESVELDESQKREFEKGDVVVGRRGNFKGTEAVVVSTSPLVVRIGKRKVRVNPSDWNKHPTGKRIRESVEHLDEAHARNIVSGLKDADGPFSVVALKNNKVVAQDNTKYHRALPAIVKELLKHVPGSTISIENKNGQVVKSFKESVELDEAFSDIFEKWEDNRDYKDEYEKFHSSAEARANRGARVQARRDMEKAGRVKKGDGKDVDHEVALSNGGSNDLDNLKVSSPSHNRGNGRVKQTEDYGAGFEGTPEYIKKLIRDTPHAQIPHNVGSMNKKGESNGTRLSKGR